MLIRQTDKEILLESLKTIKEQFKHDCLLELSYFDDKFLLTNKDCSYITILGTIDKNEQIHCYFTVLKEECRGKGLGRKYLQEQIEYCKQHFPGYHITRQVRKTNWTNLGLLIKEGFHIYNDEGKFYQLVMYTDNENGNRSSESTTNEI